MANIRRTQLTQLMQASFNQRIKKKVSKTRLQETAKKIGVLMLALWRLRIYQNIGRDSQPLKDYKSSYRKYKRDVIRNKYKDKYHKKLYSARTKYAAKGVSDKIRLSGELLDNINYRITYIKNLKTVNNFGIQLFVNDKKSKYAGHRLTERGFWLEKKGYKWFGMAESGTKREYEKRQIELKFFRLLGFGQNSKGITIK